MSEVPAIPTQTLISAAQANVVFFDAAPVFGMHNGVVAITLTAGTSIPDGAGGIQNSNNVVAYLRCNIAAALQLKDSIEKALLMASTPENESKN